MTSTPEKSVNEQPNDDAVLLEFFDSMQAVTMGISTETDVKKEVINNPEDTNLQPPL